MTAHLKKISLSLPTQPILSGARFKLDIEAIGEGLPGNGSWLQIILKGKLLTDLIFTKRPKCQFTSAHKSEVWQIVLQAPEIPGSYDMKIIFWQIESDKNHIKSTLQVLERSQKDDKLIPSTDNFIKPTDSQAEQTPHSPPHPNKKWWLLTLSGIFAIIGLLIIKNTPDPYSTTRQNKSSPLKIVQSENISVSKKSTEDIENKPVASNEAANFQFEIEGLQQQSMYAEDESLRQHAWRQLSQWMEALPTNPVLEQVKVSRQKFNQETEQWLLADKNMPEVIIRLQVLADLSDANAQLQLAQLYETGHGVVKHLGKARKWYQKASANGHQKAQQLLDKIDASADLLLNSKILKQRQLGYQIAELSALEGSLNAQLWMAYRYEHGDGVTKNNQIAIDWYRKAAAQGNSWAKEKLITLQ